MNDQRQRRVGHALRELISDILTNEIKDPRIGFVSVTDVEVSGDLRHAKVFVSVYGDDSEKQESLSGLNSAKGYIRKLVGERIRLFHTPEISFRFDPSIERGARISGILRELEQEGEMGDGNDE